MGFCGGRGFSVFPFLSLTFLQVPVLWERGCLDWFLIFDRVDSMLPTTLFDLRRIRVGETAPPEPRSLRALSALYQHLAVP